MREAYLVKWYSFKNEEKSWNDNHTIVLEQLDFIWKNSQLRELRKLWNKNYSMDYMTHYFKRDPDEIFLALFHLAKENKISRRKFGLQNGIK